MAGFEHWNAGYARPVREKKENAPRSAMAPASLN
jgi:hypothetical protein